MSEVRPAAVAGSFYPSQAEELEAILTICWEQAPYDGPITKAVIAPHAGYAYSGRTTAIALKALAKNQSIRRVLLLGPAHHFPFRGIAIPSVDFFQTPLGDIPVDMESMKKLSELPQVEEIDAAHHSEHSLEVMLPFLQKFFTDIKIVPIIIGDANMGMVAEAIELLWGGEETAVIVSTDLSHFLPYAECKEKDTKTCERISEFEAEKIKFDDACGRNAIKGLLKVAEKKSLSPRLLDLCNSGDVAGSKEQVVGYAAFSFVKMEKPFEPSETKELESQE